MVKLKILWSAEADRQFHQILLYYNAVTGNNKYGIKLSRIIQSSLKLIAHYPYMYRATSIKTTRVFVCEYFKVYYSVQENTILVESVFDTRQDPDKDIYQ